MYFRLDLQKFRNKPALLHKLHNRLQHNLQKHNHQPLPRFEQNNQVPQFVLLVVLFLYLKKLHKYRHNPRLIL